MSGDDTRAKQLTQQDMAGLIDKSMLAPALRSISQPTYAVETSGEASVSDAVKDTLSPMRSDESSSRLAIENSPSAGIDSQGCFHVRHVQVTELLEDNTLGLLLHGTSVVGFCSSRAENAGWRVGDQIVEVNGQRVGSFDEFLECFMQAQCEVGLPIDFSVLRREQRPLSETEDAEDALENFFSATNFLDLAGQLQRKFGASTDRDSRGISLENEDCNMIRSESMSIMENPYIQALKRRRDELLLSTEGWSGSIGTSASASLASQLASRKDTGIATLEDTLPLPPTRFIDAPKPCGGWPFCMADRPPGGWREGTAPINEMQPSPRVEQFDVLDGRCSLRSRRDKTSENTWAIFDVGDKNAFLPKACGETGFLVDNVEPVLPVLGSSARRTTEKENVVDQEVRQENRMNTSSLDKNSGAPGRPLQSPSSVASLNFAQQLIPVGSSRVGSSR
jgi:hypothetical protein